VKNHESLLFLFFLWGGGKFHFNQIFGSLSGSFRGPGLSICRAQVNATQELTVQEVFYYDAESYRAKKRSKPYVNVTQHDWQKRAIGYRVPCKNAFSIFKCEMKRRYKMQRAPCILHDSEDGTKHAFTFLVVEMVRGMCQGARDSRQTTC